MRHRCYQPEGESLDVTNPPKGGSGVPPKERKKKRMTRGELEKLADRLVGLSFVIAKQDGEIYRFLKAKRWLEERLTELGIEVVE